MMSGCIQLKEHKKTVRHIPSAALGKSDIPLSLTERIVVFSQPGRTLTKMSKRDHPLCPRQKSV
jgi:hypothetical protein